MASDQPNKAARREPTWGDTVRVAHGAPGSLRPGALAEVVGIRSSASPEEARESGHPVGSKMYLLEFGDGEAREVPERWVLLEATHER